MSYRLRAAGYRLAFCPAARSAHRWREGLAGYLVQRYGFGYGRVDSTAEGLEHIEPAGRVAASNQGADRRADNDIEFQAQRVEFPERADVGPAPRGAGSRGQSRLSLDGDVRRPAQA